MASTSIQSVSFAFLVGWLSCVDATFSFGSRVMNSEPIDLSDSFNMTLEDYNGPALSYDSKELRKWPGYLCDRECSYKASPRICYYDWTLEFWNVFGPACRGCQNGVFDDCYRKGCVYADGFERGILTVNRRIPGPPIRVCKFDIIVVDVKNRMPGFDESIHWHGMLQHGTPWMDGVGYVNQCPIGSDNTMRYAFIASKRDTGTNYYHSHTGHHKVNGIFGSLIVKDVKKHDPNGHLYDCDEANNTILISDWHHEYAEDKVPGLQNISQLPVSILMNGAGVYRDPQTNSIRRVPLPVFRMHPRRCRSQRFRVINSDSSVCPMQLQIEQHRLKIIATDSYSIKPIVVDSYYSAAGERCDFVLPSQQPGPGTEYWMVVTASGICSARNIVTYAVLSYADDSISDRELAINTRPFPTTPFPEGIYLNKVNQPCGGINYCSSDLENAERYKSAYEEQRFRQEEPDDKIVLGFNNYALPQNEEFHHEIFHDTSNIGRTVFVGSVNNLTLSFAHISLVTQCKDIVDNYGPVDYQTFCDERHRPSRCNGFPQCPCTHRQRIKLGSIVDLYMVDETPAAIPLGHPWHLHGHSFRVRDQFSARPNQTISVDLVRKAIRDGTFNQQFGQLRRAGVDYGDPAKKDTTQVPSKGVSVLRVHFDNPGFWLMHCHIDWHLGIGMAFILQVGECSDFAPAPPYFPRCGDYKPTLVLD